MNNKIECPKCNETIKSEKFDFRVDSDAPWYRYKKTKIHCPHCGIRLKYGSSTNTYMYLTVAVLLFLVILSTLDLTPAYTVAFAPIILILVFWKIRKLCLY